MHKYGKHGIPPLACVPKHLHDLRKEAGTLVNTQHGLNEAKSFLRLNSMATTAAYDVGSNGDITTGLS